MNSPCRCCTATRHTWTARGPSIFTARMKPSPAGPESAQIPAGMNRENVEALLIATGRKKSGPTIIVSGKRRPNEFTTQKRGPKQAGRSIKLAGSMKKVAA